MITDPNDIFSILNTSLETFNKSNKQTQKSREFAALIAEFALLENKNRAFSKIVMFYHNLSNFCDLKPFIRFSFLKIFRIPLQLKTYSYLTRKNRLFSAYAEQEDNLNEILDSIMLVEKRRQTIEKLQPTTKLSLPINQIIGDYVAEEKRSFEVKR